MQALSALDESVSRKHQDSINVSVFGRNALIYSMGNLGLRAGSFLLIPLYTPALPIDRYGALASLLMVAQVLGMCMDAGTRKAITRFAAEFEENGRMHQLVGTAIVLTLLCRSEEHTSELQSQSNLVCRLLLEKKN